METFNHYRLSREIFTFQHEEVIETILKVANPDMIFLMGATLNRKRCESIFSDWSHTSHTISHPILLILIPDVGNKELHDWQDKIEGHCNKIIPVTTLVLQSSTFKKWIQEGHRFPATIWKYAPMLYKNGNVFRDDMKVPKVTISKKELTKLLEDGLSKASEFIEGAELFRIRNHYTMAAFMLHQSAEQGLRTLLKIGTGYHASTHSIDRLFRYASLVSTKLGQLFAQQTEQDKNLLKLLQKAYIHSRYKEDYRITDEELLALTNKIRRIHEVLAETGKDLLSTEQSGTPAPGKEMELEDLLK